LDFIGFVGGLLSADAINTTQKKQVVFGALFGVAETVFFMLMAEGWFFLKRNAQD